MLVLQFNMHLSSFIQRGSQLWGYIQALFTMKDCISFILHLLKYVLDGAKVWTVMGGWCPKFWLSKGECTIPIEVFLQQNGVTFAWQVHTFPLHLTGPSLVYFCLKILQTMCVTIVAITQQPEKHLCIYQVICLATVAFQNHCWHLHKLYARHDSHTHT